MLVVTAAGRTATGAAVAATTELYLTPFRTMAFPSTTPVVNVTVAPGADSSTAVVTVVTDGVVPLLTVDVVGTQSGFFSDSSFLALPGRPITLMFTSWAPIPSIATFAEDLEVRSVARPIKVVR